MIVDLLVLGKVKRNKERASTLASPGKMALMLFMLQRFNSAMDS